MYRRQTKRYAVGPALWQKAPAAIVSTRTEGVGNPFAGGARAGIAYGVIVFAMGCGLGTIRVLLLAPRVGPTMAASVEVPIILTASWYLASTLTQRLGVSVAAGPRILMGAVAFAALMSMEMALSVGLFRRSIGDYLASVRSPGGAIGLAAQVCFATFPLADAIVRRRSRAACLGRAHLDHENP